MRFALICVLTLCCVAPARACQTALQLTLDVSNSIDPGEYRLQVDGLVSALSDPEIVDELVAGQVALSVVQWSGVGQQSVSLPWARMNSHADAKAFAAAASQMRRAYVGSNTAVGGLIDFALAQFAQVADCNRHVIDISGDGQDNAGTDPLSSRARAEARNVQINGIAIERTGLAISQYYRNHVRTRDGFVMTARGFADYARTLREKIKREITRVLF